MKFASPGQQAQSGERPPNLGLASPTNTSDAKDRTADGGRPELVAVTNAKDAEGRLEWMKVESEGPVEPEVTQQDRVMHRIIAAAREAGEAEIAVATLAEAAGVKPGDGTFKRAKQAAEDSGQLVKVKRGF